MDCLNLKTRPSRRVQLRCSRVWAGPLLHTPTAPTPHSVDVVDCLYCVQSPSRHCSKSKGNLWPALSLAAHAARVYESRLLSKPIARSGPRDMVATNSNNATTSIILTVHHVHSLCHDHDKHHDHHRQHHQHYHCIRYLFLELACLSLSLSLSLSLPLSTAPFSFKHPPAGGLVLCL